MTTPQMNGRIDIMSSRSKLDIPAYGQVKSENNSTFCKEALYGGWERSDLSDVFFSQDNIEALQSGIRYMVYKQSNGRFTIGRQSDQELKIIMKAVYLQNAKHDPSRSSIAQARDLNKLILEYSVPNIVSNLQQYEQYRMDISTLPVPIDRSSFISNKGTKTLETKSFF